MPRSKSLGKSKRKLKNNTKAIREIKKYQQSSDLLIGQSTFRQILQQLRQESGIENGLSKSAVLALQEAAENYLVDLFESSSLCTIHSNRVTLHPRDIHLALSVKGDKLKQ